MSKFFISLVFLVLVGFAFAQNFSDDGVNFVVDDFDNSTVCSQTINIDDLSISLVNYDRDPTTVVWFMFIDNYPNGFPYYPSTTLSEPLSGEELLVKLTDNIQELMFLVETERSFQSVIVIMDPDYMWNILSHDGNVRVRLGGDNYNYDFDFTTGMRLTFRSNFFTECVPSTIGG